MPVINLQQKPSPLVSAARISRIRGRCETGQLSGLSISRIVVCHENFYSVCRIRFYLELNPADDCDYLPISCFSKPLSMILHDGARGPWRWRIPPPKPASAGIHRTVGDGSGELGLPPADYGVWGRRKLPQWGLGPSPSHQRFS